MMVADVLKGGGVQKSFRNALFHIYLGVMKHSLARKSIEDR